MYRPSVTWCIGLISKSNFSITLCFPHGNGTDSWPAWWLKCDNQISRLGAIVFSCQSLIGCLYFLCILLACSVESGLMFSRHYYPYYYYVWIKVTEFLLTSGHTIVSYCRRLYGFCVSLNFELCPFVCNARLIMGNYL